MLAWNAGGQNHLWRLNHVVWGNFTALKHADVWRRRWIFEIQKRHEKSQYGGDIERQHLLINRCQLIRHKHRLCQDSTELELWVRKRSDSSWRWLSKTHIWKVPQRYPSRELLRLRSLSPDLDTGQSPRLAVSSWRLEHASCLVFTQRQSYGLAKHISIPTPHAKIRQR